MKNKILTLMIIIGLIFSLFGCQQNNTIIKPDVETKTVTENSMDDYVTFTFEMPLDWDIYAKDKNSLVCVSPDVNKTEFNEEISPCLLNITNYITPDIYPVADEYKQAYEDLFKGKYKGIEKVLNDSIEYINIGKVMDSFPDVKFETSESIMDYFNILADGLSTPDITAPESWEDKEWATDFTYSEYNGKNGKIIAVEYSCVIINKTYKAINCYRDDDYSVCGVFDDETELSSGDLALWIADNIEVSEHYKLEDNVVKKEGVDYQVSI